MAVLEVINPARLNETTLPTWQDLRVDVGVVVMRRAPDHLGWRIVAAAVRRHQNTSPEMRALGQAFLVALIVAPVVIRLIVIVGQ